MPFGIALGRRLAAELGGRVEREAYAVAMSVEDHFEAGTTGPMQAMAVSFSDRIGGRVLITDAEGTLVADSLDPPQKQRTSRLRLFPTHPLSAIYAGQSLFLAHGYSH